MEFVFENFLEGVEYYDYPSFGVALYSLLLALVLSTLIAYTYRFTYALEEYSRNFFQAIVLSPLVTSMIMMAVGNNLAVGFGIIGAVAIIRFRTNIQNPRNIVFIFASLSVGIACGAHGYAVALAGSLIFIATAFLLHFSSARETQHYKYDVVCRTTDHELMRRVKQHLMDTSKTFEEKELRKRNEMDDRFEYTITLHEGQDIQGIFQYLIDRDTLSDVRINKKQILDQL